MLAHWSVGTILRGYRNICSFLQKRGLMSNLGLQLKLIDKKNEPISTSYSMICISVRNPMQFTHIQSHWWPVWLSLQQKKLPQPHVKSSAPPCCQLSSEDKEAIYIDVLFCLALMYSELISMNLWIAWHCMKYFRKKKGFKTAPDLIQKDDELTAIFRAAGNGPRPAMPTPRRVKESYAVDVDQV